MFELLAQNLPTDASTWAKTGGILGLIILFLLSGGAALVRWLVSFISEQRADAREQSERFRKYLDEQAAKHRAERVEWQSHYRTIHEQHRDERKEWRETTTKSNEDLRTSIETQNHELAEEIERGLEKGLERLFAEIEKRQIKE